MAGDDKRRFCAHCQLHVHNLSAMSPAEQHALLSQTPGRRCIGYVAGDRSIHVRGDVWLQFQRLLGPWRAAVAMIVLLLPFISAGCASTRSQPPPASPPAACEQYQAPPDGKITLGEFIPDRPLWHRVLFFWQR